MTREEYPSWLCLKNTPDLGPRQCREILAHYPDPTEFVGNLDHPVYSSGLLKESSARHLQEAVLPNNFTAILKLMDHYGIQCLSLAEYPVRLKDIFLPPLLLYVRGDKQSLFKAKNLAVVGTRKASAYGREMCARLIAPLCRRDVNIISGLALGIDTFAHKTALAEGGCTVAVLAAGLDSIYPSQNLELAKKIEEKGALVSEYEPGSKADVWNFPARNRIISALSQLVFVVEGPITSGALLTAKNALQQDRDLCALPGNINHINAQGPNHLIKNGAGLISSAEDLAALLDLNVEESPQLEISAILSKDEQIVYDLLKKSHGSLSFDDILIQTGFNIGKMSTLLTNMELKGIIAKEGGNSFFAL